MTPAKLEVCDEFSLDGTGLARFTPDGKMRFRLARSLVPAIRISIGDDGLVFGIQQDLSVVVDRVVFLMLNPSLADAFKPDHTVHKCIRFAQRWGAQVLEVVNLFALVSPYPADLDRADNLGIDEFADREILNACRGAKRVIAAWGNGGDRRGRDQHVRELLRAEGIVLEHLGLTGSGMPLHPLARGKHFIPLDREPVVWS